jgi:group I intron endonuclease
VIKPKIIYRIFCFATGKHYVGEGVSLQARKNHHLSELRRGVHHSPQLQADFDLFGEYAFIFVMEDEDGTGKEKEYIRKYNSMHPNGYNIREASHPSYKVPCDWNGKHYESRAAAARDNDLDAGALRKWVLMGCKCDADVPYQATLERNREEIQARKAIIERNNKPRKR